MQGKSYIELYGEEKALQRINKVSRENNYNWKGGFNKKDYSIEWTSFLRRKIRKRDNYACQICGKLQSEDKSKLDVHHIDYNKKNCVEDNLISLCKSCHTKTNINRPYWIKYFGEKYDN